MTDRIPQRNYYGKALAELARDDPRVVVMDADLAGSTKTSDFQKACPERFVEVGIAEQNMIGIASGLAASGKVTSHPSLRTLAFPIWNGSSWSVITGKSARPMRMYAGPSYSARAFVAWNTSYASAGQRTTMFGRVRIMAMSSNA